MPRMWLHRACIDISRSTYGYDIAAATAAVLVAYLLCAFYATPPKPDPKARLWFERRQLIKHADRRQKRKQTRDVAQRFASTSSSLAICWGSQTGTAEGAAIRLARELRSKFAINALVIDLSEIDAESLEKLDKKAVVVFILSTYGEGDPPDNCAAFWKWARQDTKNLEDVQLAAFGLGNSDYINYNNFVKDVTKHLFARGATAVVETGMADASKGGLEHHFLPWTEKLCHTLQAKFNYDLKPSRFLPVLRVAEVDPSPGDSSGEPIIPRQAPGGIAPSSPPAPYPITGSRDLTTNSPRSCLHMELDIPSPAMKYKTGDHIAIWPINPESEVLRLLCVLGRTEARQKTYKVELEDDTSSFDMRKRPTSATLESLLRHYLSICEPLPWDAIKTLESFAPTEAARTRISALCESKSWPPSEIARLNMTLSGILDWASEGKAEWTELPLAWIIENLSAMCPRLYSISSSAAVQPRRVSVTVAMRGALVEGPNNELGLTTKYLRSLHGTAQSSRGWEQPNTVDELYSTAGPKVLLAGGKIFAQLRPSNFKMPQSFKSSIVMIAAGTGIAPFRAFIHERARLKRMGHEVGEMLLFYGCRHLEQDYLYKEELEELGQTLGPELSIYPAFSRPSSKLDVAPSYVQHQLAKHGTEVAELLRQPSCTFYVCGSAAMARGCAQAVVEILKSAENWDTEQGYAFLERARKTKKWQEDVWG
jgi:NADPH-ferrihemoprotein reductase